MKQLQRYIYLLLLLDILLFISGYFISAIPRVDLKFSQIVLLTLSFSVIAMVTLIIFMRGQTKDPESQTLHSLVSIVLKFMLEMILALVWFIVAKKTSLSSVFIFFVIYLTISLFSVYIILKVLKNKSL